MNDYFKYLTHSNEDLENGFYLTVGGHAKVLPETDYPPKGHPSGYNFDWNKGRILHEYQINYITEGEGIIETNDGEFEIKEGSILLIKPNSWHRYKPLKSTGWMEHYVGFNGDFADKIIENSLVFQNTPVVQIDFQEKIVEEFYKIFNYIKSEKPGYQQICTGLVIYILGLIISLKKNENFKSSEIEKSIQKACLFIRDNLNQNINVEGMAESLKIDYSIFRKAFKKYTGLSPIQYHLSLRMQQAAYLLTNSNQSIKEISFNLGFSSVFYFSKLFKEKMNATPSDFREKSLKT
ncbi:MAG TPA: AraC family transcriptional regulator [Bacteroidales bacterium]|nr:AraC family transcriptional regulator [Bacteroidales bacterium]